MSYHRALNALVISALLLPIACSDDDPSEQDNNTRIPMRDTGSDAGADDAQNGGDDTGEDSGDDRASDLEKAQAFTGQIGDEEAPGGGSYTTDLSAADYASDAGLKAIYDRIAALVTDGTITTDDPLCVRDEQTGMFPPDDDPCRTPDVREDRLELEAADQLQVTDAVVTATSFDQRDPNRAWIGSRQIWLQDEQAAMQIFLPQGEVFATEEGDPIKVGDKVSFTATTIGAFRGNQPQISAVSGVTRSAEDVTIGVMEKTGEALALEDWGKLVKVVGTITEEGEPCGTCFQFTHGDQTSVLTSRINDVVTSRKTIEEGDIGSFVGPLGSFPGVLSTDPMPSAQLNSDNFSWYFGPFKSQN